MAKQKTNPYRRKPLDNRPWIKNYYWDRVTKDGTLHIDVHAQQYKGRTWLVFDMRAGGKARYKIEVYEITGGFVHKHSGTMPEMWRPTWWGTANKDMFRAVHGWAVRHCIEQLTAPFHTVFPLFHYVRVDDSEPMRGIRNHWRYGPQAAVQY